MEAKSVKRFERSNGLDTALYKNYLFGCNYVKLVGLPGSPGSQNTERLKDNVASRNQ